MGYGILIFKNFSGEYCSFVLREDKLYDKVYKEMEKDGIDIIYGKKGLDVGRAESINLKVDGLVKKLNNGQPVILKELEGAFS